MLVLGAFLTTEHDQHVDVEEFRIRGSVPPWNHAFDHEQSGVVRHRKATIAQDCYAYQQRAMCIF